MVKRALLRVLRAVALLVLRRCGRPRAARRHCNRRHRVFLEATGQSRRQGRAPRAAEEHAQLRIQPGRSRRRRAHIAPIAFKGDTAAAMAAVRKAVESMPGATIVRAEGGYLYAEYRSKLMRFVDDVEFFHDGKAGLIHVRSASRLGRRDFGVNRARVESLRARIEGKPRS